MVECQKQVADIHSEINPLFCMSLCFVCRRKHCTNSAKAFYCKEGSIQRKAPNQVKKPPSLLVSRA